MGKTKRWHWVGIALAAAVALVAAAIWLQQDAEEIVPPRIILPGHPGGVRTVAFFPDGKTLLSAGGDNAVRLWDLYTGRLLDTKSFSSLPDFSIAAVSHDGRTAAVCGYGELRLWDIATGAVRTLKMPNTDMFYEPRFFPDDRKIAAIVDDRMGHETYSLCVWDVETGALLHTLKGVQRDNKVGPEYTIFANLTAGAVAAIGAGNSIKVWDPHKGALLHTLSGHTALITHIAYSPDGKSIASSSWDKTIRIWDLKTGALIQKIEGDGKYDFGWVEYSQDGKSVVSEGLADLFLTIWDAKTGALLQKVRYLGKNLSYVVYSPDRKKMFVVSSPYSMIFDAATWKRLQTLLITPEQPYCRAWSQDGKAIALGGFYDGEIRIWDIEDDAERRQRQ
ncbi:MAG: WD40 repeat domain-containing protein [Candidatus Poribacteria bacterium]|nr:WD40 repeat domain-containing protein [Candidatus Poribacteria bacterium]